MLKKLFFLLLFIVAAVSLVGFWYYQRNIYSKEVLKLELLGPEKPQAFEEVEYIVKYKNNGNVTLEDVRLIFEFPETSILSKGQQQRKVEMLDDIYPGQERTLSYKARLVGAEGSVSIANVSVSYRPKNLKARYESKTSHTAVISSVPFNLELDLPKQIDSGRPFSFWINYFSNVDYPISGLRVSIDYPSGFNFLQSRPRGLDKNEWELGLLNKAEGGRIEIQGSVQGEIYEQKNFRVTLGLWQDGEFTLLKETTRGLAIIRPSLYISQSINGSQDYIAEAGDLLHYEVFFRNAGQEVFENLFLVVKLDGIAYDLQSVRTGQGSFKTGDNSIIFDWQKVPQLRFLGSGEEGRVEFWVELKKQIPLRAGDKNLFVKNTVYISQIREEFITKIRANLNISQSVYFKEELLGNSGPIPPKVGETTTYTVVWRAQGLYNDIEDAKVKAILPEKVKLTGEMFPEESRLTFDLQSREIVWEIGDLEAQESAEGERSSVAFQVALTPEEEDKGNIIPLIGAAKISGRDKWTGLIIEDTAPARDTSLPDDPNISEEQGIVE